jgi:hypothetical protein
MQVRRATASMDQPALGIRARERAELVVVDMPMTFEAVGTRRGRT